MTNLYTSQFDSNVIKNVTIKHEIKHQNDL